MLYRRGTVNPSSEGCNIDTFMGELHRTGFWNTWAATCAFVAFMCDASLFYGTLRRREK
jgi:hypothetical protein